MNESGDKSTIGAATAVMDRPPMLPAEAPDVSPAVVEPALPVAVTPESNTDPLVAIGAKLEHFKSMRTGNDSADRKMRHERQRFFKEVLETQPEDVQHALAVKDKSYRALYLKQKANEIALTPQGNADDPLSVIDKQVALYKSILLQAADTLPLDQKEHYLKKRLTANVGDYRRTMIKKLAKTQPDVAAWWANKNKYMQKVVDGAEVGAPVPAPHVEAMPAPTVDMAAMRAEATPDTNYANNLMQRDIAAAMDARNVAPEPVVTPPVEVVQSSTAVPEAVDDPELNVQNANVQIDPVNGRAFVNYKGEARYLNPDTDKFTMRKDPVTGEFTQDAIRASKWERSPGQNRTRDLAGVGNQTGDAVVTDGVGVEPVPVVTEAAPVLPDQTKEYFASIADKAVLAQDEGDHQNGVFAKGREADGAKAATVSTGEVSADASADRVKRTGEIASKAKDMILAKETGTRDAQGRVRGAGRRRAATAIAALAIATVLSGDALAPDIAHDGGSVQTQTAQIDVSQLTSNGPEVGVAPAVDPGGAFVGNGPESATGAGSPVTDATVTVGGEISGDGTGIIEAGRGVESESGVTTHTFVEGETFGGVLSGLTDKEAIDAWLSAPENQQQIRDTIKANIGMPGFPATAEEVDAVYQQIADGTVSPEEGWKMLNLAQAGEIYTIAPKLVTEAPQVVSMAATGESELGGAAVENVAAAPAPELGKPPENISFGRRLAGLFRRS